MPIPIPVQILNSHLPPASHLESGLIYLCPVKPLLFQTLNIHLYCHLFNHSQFWHSQKWLISKDIITYSPQCPFNLMGPNKDSFPPCIDRWHTKTVGMGGLCGREEKQGAGGVVCIQELYSQCNGLGLGDFYFRGIKSYGSYMKYSY